MVKPCHAITKCEPTLPRPFFRAFHPIYLVAAGVTRLKLHLASQFDDLPAFVPTGINLIRPKNFSLGWRQLVATTSPASGQPPGGHGPQHSAPQPATQSSPPSTSNMQRATSNLKLQPPAMPLAGRASAPASALSYFKLF